jgi:hypothetical protein
MNCSQSPATDVELVPRQQPSHTAAARLLVITPSVKHAVSPAEQGFDGVGVALQLSRPLSSFRVQLRPAASLTKRERGGSGSSLHAARPKAATNSRTEGRRDAVKPTFYHDLRRRMTSRQRNARAVQSTSSAQIDEHEYPGRPLLDPSSHCSPNTQSTMASPQKAAMRQSP